MKATTTVLVLLAALISITYAVTCDTVLFPLKSPGWNVIKGLTSFPATPNYPSDAIYNSFSATTESASWGNGAPGCGLTPVSSFPTNTILIVKRTISFSAADVNSVTIRINVDNDVLVYWNGVEVARAQIASNQPGYTLSGGWITHEGCANANTYVVTIPKASLLNTNTLIVVARDRGSVSYLDLTASINGACGCGNGIVENGEQCDAGTAGSTICRPDCQFVCSTAQSNLCSSMGFSCCGNGFNGLEQCYSLNDYVCPFFNTHNYMCPITSPLLCNGINGLQCYSAASHVCVTNQFGNKVLCPASQPFVCGVDFCYSSSTYNCQGGQLVPLP